MRSMYFEELTVGMRFETVLSDPFTIEDVEDHARRTGDRVHKRHATTDKIVVQGNLVTARTGGLLFEAGHFNDTLVFQAEKRIKYLNPLFVGDRIHVVETIMETIDQPGRSTGVVILSRQTFNQDNLLIQDVWQDYRIKKR